MTSIPKPSLPGMPAMPAMPTMPSVALPSLPSVAIPSLPALPSVAMPAMPAMPALPAMPSLPGMPAVALPAMPTAAGLGAPKLPGASSEPAGTRGPHTRPKPRVIPSFPHIPIAGGLGTVPAWGRPDLVIHAPAGIVATTPAHSVMSAGKTVAVVASQDINISSQRHTAVAVKKGISLFTYGKASNPDKPNQETGMQLHAASGSVSVQAQANTFSLAADQAVSVASTTDAVTISSPQHVLLTAGGSSLRITSGGITLTTSGPVLFKAAMKELTGGASASASLSLPKPGKIQGCAMQLAIATQNGSAVVDR